MKLFKVPEEYEFIEYNLIERYLKQLYSIWKDQLPKYYYDYFIEEVNEHYISSEPKLEKFLSLLFFEDFKFEYFDINELSKMVILEFRQIIEDGKSFSSVNHLTHSKNLIEQLMKEGIKYEPTMMRKKEENEIEGLFSGNHRITAHYLLNHKEIKCCVIEISKKPIIQVSKEISEMIEKWRYNV